MTNPFIDQPEFFRRVVSIVAPMTQSEAEWFLMFRTRSGYYYRLLADALDIETRRRHRNKVVEEILGLLNESTPDTPIEPSSPIPPSPPNFRPVACNGCGSVGDTPVFLRWRKVEQGKPVTVSIDFSGRPATLAWLDADTIMREWFDPWTVDTSITFKLLKRGKGDIHLRFEPVDGPGKVRGFAWQPAQSVEFMEQGGDLSGDMVIDSIDRWTTRDEVNETGEHEVGHAIGLPHTDSPRDVMYRYSRGVRVPHSRNDKLAKTKRYPPRAIAA